MPSKITKVCSVRLDNDFYFFCKRRAESMGWTMSDVLSEFIGIGNDLLDGSVDARIDKNYIIDRLEDRVGATIKEPNIELSEQLEIEKKKNKDLLSQIELLNITKEEISSDALSGLEILLNSKDDEIKNLEKKNKVFENSMKWMQPISDGDGDGCYCPQFQPGEYVIDLKTEVRYMVLKVIVSEKGMKYNLEEVGERYNGRKRTVSSNSLMKDNQNE